MFLYPFYDKQSVFLQNQKYLRNRVKNSSPWEDNQKMILTWKDTQNWDNKSFNLKKKKNKDLCMEWKSEDIYKRTINHL